MSTLAIVPTFVRSPEELRVVAKTLATLRFHEPDLETLVVDDCSPVGELVPELEQICEDVGTRVHLKKENTGFASAVNVGLAEALERGLDAVLVNADIEFVMPFLEVFESTQDSKGRPAAVVGALLLYPNGLIQSGGTYLDLYSRGFDHRFRYAPGGLPEAHEPMVTLVTAALQFIRHSTLETVGLYEEDFGLGFEDVSHGLWVFDADLECVYNPAVRAVHHESLFRGQGSDKIDKWHQQALGVLYDKHGTTPLGRFVPSLA